MELLIGIVIGLVLAIIIGGALLRMPAAEAKPECEHEWKITREENRFSVFPSFLYYKQSPPCRVWSKCSKCNKTKVEDFN
jgi:hypothetical protein